MRNTEGAVPGEDAPAGRELVERLDHAAAMPDQRSGRSSAELNVGFLLWPRFPLLSLVPAGNCIPEEEEPTHQTRESEHILAGCHPDVVRHPSPRFVLPAYLGKIFV